jgi:hypothetical protein
MNVRDSLVAMRQEFLNKLRPYDPMTVAELEKIIRALEAIDPREVQPGEFSSSTIIEAIKVYLLRVKQPVAISELTRVLLIGGAGSSMGSRPPEWRISQSISHHASRNNLVVKDGMVSLPEKEGAQH